MTVHVDLHDARAALRLKRLMHKFKRIILPEKELTLSKQTLWIIFLCFLGVAHRSLLFGIYFEELHTLISHNAEWLTWQYLPLSALKEHLGASLLYLQQSPPLPNLILGLIIKIFGFPYGTAYALIGLQGLLSIIATTAIFRLLCRFQPNIMLNGIIASVFLLSSDVVIMEYNSFGQTCYENLTMVLLLWLLSSYCKLLETGRLTYSILMGVFTAALALCRASFSYFFPIPFLGIILVKGISKKRHLLMFSAVILILHGGWVIKNAAVYHTWSLSTSSWKGINFTSGLSRTGMTQPFLETLLRDKNAYPDWFLAMNARHGLVGWKSKRFQPYLPLSVKKEEHRIQTALHNANPSENSIGQRIISDLYMKAYTRFLFTHPELAVQKLMVSYLKFWEPIRNYGIMFMGPIFVIPQIRNPFLVHRAIGVYLSQGLEQTYVMKGTLGEKYGLPAPLYTIPYLPIMFLLLNIISLHLLLPCLILYILWRGGYRRLFGEELFLVLCLSYAYAAIVMNLPDYGENMRFRMSIEPVIWLLSTYTVTSIVTYKKFLTRKKN